MASVLRQLSDEHLEQVHHMIRRDAMSDLEIARAAERIGGISLGETEGAKRGIIRRYRESKQFNRWHLEYKAQFSEMEKALAQQRNRYEFIVDTLQTPGGTGIEKISKALQAKALTLAAEAPDEDFLLGLQGKGWVANILKLAQTSVQDHYRQKCDELKRQLTALTAGGGDEPALDMATVVSKVDEIMGLR